MERGINMNVYDPQKKIVSRNGITESLYVGRELSALQLAVVGLYMEKEKHTLQEWVALFDAVTRKELTK